MSKLSANLALKDLASKRNVKRAADLSRFFKTGKGEYGEGDVFYGLTVPLTRSFVAKYKGLDFVEITKLLNSKVHEARFLALEILVEQFNKGDEKTKKQVFNFYLKSTKRVNNWDLVDTSAPYIVGKFLHNKPYSILFKLAKSKNLWEKRIAIVSTAHLISKDFFKPTLEISELLLKDEHDLIHKAVGWMLREVGKRDLSVLKRFLKAHISDLPRTTLRYAIERFPEAERKKFLSGQVK